MKKHWERLKRKQIKLVKFKLDAYYNYSLAKFRT